VSYGLGADGRIDYGQVARLARQHRPRLIFCGASAYPRTIDFPRFRAIADEADAYLVADISHIAGLVAAGAHPSPIDVAHVTTTSTYKQLYGPRGGLILSGRDADRPTLSGKSLARTLQDAVFPFLQGTPRLNTIAAKARAFALADTPEFRARAVRIAALARALASELARLGHPVLTGGTDTHMVLLDVSMDGLTGRIAEAALESCDIVVNKNTIPGDRHGPRVASGVRLGTNVLALRGMGQEQILSCARLVSTVLRRVQPRGDRDYRLDEATRSAVRSEVAALCRDFPLPGYPAPAAPPPVPVPVPAAAAGS